MIDDDLVFEHQLRAHINTFKEMGRVARHTIAGREHGDIAIEFSGRDGGIWEVSNYDREHVKGSGAQLKDAYHAWETSYRMAHNNRVLPSLIAHIPNEEPF